MATLVFLESHGGELQKGSLGVLAKAASLGDVAAAIAGEGSRGLAAEAGKFGATKVWVCEDAEVAQPLPQPRVDVLAQVVADGGYDTVLFANSVLAADVAAGLAARLDAGLNWDLADLEIRDGEVIGTRPALQDSVYVDVGWTSTPRLALFRAGSFDATPAGGGEPEVVDVSPTYAPHSTAREARRPGCGRVERPVDRGRRRDRRRRPRPRRARQLHPRRGARKGAGRRGRRDARGRLRGLVSVLGPDRPDGQDGLAEALRRARHLRRDPAQGRHAELRARSSRSTRISNAPIFEFSDLGVVGDVHAIVPKLTELIRQRRGS